MRKWFEKVESEASRKLRLAIERAEQEQAKARKVLRDNSAEAVVNDVLSEVGSND